MKSGKKVYPITVVYAVIVLSTLLLDGMHDVEGQWIPAVPSKKILPRLLYLPLGTGLYGITHSLYQKYLSQADIPTIPQGKGLHKIGISTSKGDWITAEHGGGSYLIGNRGLLSSWETFFMDCYEEDCSRFALQTNDTKQWVTAEGGGGGDVTANRSIPQAWETFTLIPLADGKVAFRTMDGSYLTAHPKTDLIQANKRTVGPSEQFSIEILE